MLIVRNKWRNMVYGGGCNQHKVTTVSFNEIVDVMGLRTLATRLYSLAFPKVKHQGRRMDKETSKEQ
jgi:hypothetical protein